MGANETKPLDKSSDIKEEIKSQETSDSPNVDLCFMLDCTGSMSSYIFMSCNKIKDIIAQVHQTYPNSEVRVAVVAYRDIQDGKLRHEVLPFTYSVDTAKGFLDKLVATGGGDTPEDVNGGFVKTLGLDWKSGVRMLVHIADAPCHGKEFHNCDDNHPKGYKGDKDWNKIFKELVEKRLDYLFLKINDSTDKMFEKFKALAGKHGAVQAEITFEQQLANIEPMNDYPRCSDFVRGGLTSLCEEKATGESEEFVRTTSVFVSEKNQAHFANVISGTINTRIQREVCKNKVTK